MTPRIAHIVVGLPVETHFDYIIPPALASKIKIGQRVRVPFRKETLTGFVVGTAEKSEFKFLKPIFDILEENPCLDPYAMKWTKLLSEHYACSWGEAIEVSLPSVLRKPRPAEIPAVQSPVIPPLKHETFLLHDPAMSAYWEHLYTALGKILLHGQSIIFLVPEVHQIADIVNKLKQRFDQPILALDQKLKTKEELDQWLSMKSGNVKIVVGTRSAVFAPVPSLGAIVILEEESEGYRQEQSPAYHANIVAHLRAFVQSCHVFLISAAPSAETWWQAQENQIQKTFFPPQQSAEFQLFDLSNYGAKQSLVSFPLRNLLEKVLAENGKAVLFMNRKGFSMVTRCNQCGHSVRCPRCDISLTYLYSKKKMVCRRCTFVTEVPKVCPKCRSTYLRSVGTGSEKLESELNRVFPSARIARYEKETKNIPKHANIIIATQAVLRILPELSADTLAVLQFDAFLNRVDFRSAVKTFSLVTSLRHQVKKRIVIQTFQRDNYSVRALHKMDFDSFYQEELKLRQELNFPPFSYLVTIHLRGAKEAVVLEQAADLFEHLKAKETPGIEILDPQPDTITKLRDQYRFTIMLKGPTLENILSLTKANLKGFKKKTGVIITTTVDP